MLEFCGQIGWKFLFLEDLDWIQVSLKTFKLTLMHFIHEILRFEKFLHKTALFFKSLKFQDFQLIEAVARPIENTIKI